MKTTLEEVQAYIGRCTPAWAAAGIRVHSIIMDGNSAVGYLPTAPCIIGGKQ